MLKHILRTDFNRDPNIGLFAVATDAYLLTGSSFDHKTVGPVEEVLQIRAKHVLAAETNLVGLFIAANSNGIVVPKIMEKEELAVLKKICKSLDLNLTMLRTKETALGNIVLANDKGCVVSRDLKDVKNEIRDALGVDVETATIAELDIVGACGVATNRGLLVHRNCSPEELELIERVLGVRGDIGSVSFGSPFVGAGVIANTHGFVASRSTTGPELQRIDEALGFVQPDK